MSDYKDFIVLYGWGTTHKVWDGRDSFGEILRFRDELYPNFPIYQLVKEERLYQLPDGEVIRDGDAIAAGTGLLGALEETLQGCCELVNSGDAGFWDPETDQFVINTRAAMAKERAKRREANDE